jgi:hypothetical protein
MSLADLAAIVIAASAALGLLWAITRFVFVPHLRGVVTETMEPQMAKLPELTVAVVRLTDAITRQSADAELLGATVDGIDGKLDRITERTATIEGSLSSLADATTAAATVARAAAAAADAASVAATAAAATVLATAKTVAAHLARSAKPTKRRRT